MAAHPRNRPHNVQRIESTDPAARDEGPRLIPLEKRPPRASPNARARFPAGIYHTGDSVPVTGIFTAVHACEAKEIEIMLFRDAFFPRCPHCGNLHFRLLRSAPQISEDEDFR
jgi:hypothetical protein